MTAAPSGLHRALAYRRFWIVAVLVLIADQLTKYWVVSTFPPNSYNSHGYTVFPGFFNIVHVGNTGAAWSMFSGQGTLLACVAIGTLIAIFFWRQQLGLRAPLPQICFGLLCGGTVGNLYDRLRHGHVIDFLDFHFGSYTFPTFNVADSGICVGVISYILWSLKQPTPSVASDQ